MNVRKVDTSEVETLADLGDAESLIQGVATRHGSIDYLLNTASLAGLIPGGFTSIYSASKHAVVGFSLTLRAETRRYGIEVSTLCPGYMRTNIQKTTENVSSDHQNDEEAGGFTKSLRKRIESAEVL